MQRSSCKNFKGLAVVDGDPDTEMLVARLRCKKWDCEFCAVKNRQIWRAHIIDTVNKMGGEWLFVTLTAHRKAHSDKRTIENLKSAWKRLYDRLRYKFKGQKLEYVWLYEKHTGTDAKGQPKQTYHVHMILRAVVAGGNKWNARKKYWYHPEMHNWLKDNAAAIGAGYMAHAAKIEESNGGLVAAYITKYMTKDAQNLQGFPRGMRRIQTSRAFGSPQTQESPLSWEFRAHLLRGDIARHVKTTDVSTGRTVKLEHFEKHELYPAPGEDD